MTAMPQMVALFNGSGGGAAALVSALEYRHLAVEMGSLPMDSGIGILLGALIGAVSFSGSIVAFGKLQGIFTEHAVTYPLQKVVNGTLLAAILVLGWLALTGPGSLPILLAFLAGSLLLGILAVIPIGGGDMPVVISLLNSFTGLATAATGFALHNAVLIISGTLVGASGTLLTYLMCKAMNRPITNVLFGAFGRRPRRPRPPRRTGRARWPSGRCATSPSRTRRRSSPTRSRSSSCRATGWPWRRPSTRCGSWRTCSRRAAWR